MGIMEKKMEATIITISITIPSFHSPDGNLDKIFSLTVRHADLRHTESLAKSFPMTTESLFVDAP